MLDNLKQQFETIRAQLAADKKKAIIMGVLLLVLLFAVGRLFFTSSNPDATTAAEPPLVPVATAPQAAATTPTVSPVPQQATSPTRAAATPSVAAVTTSESQIEKRSISVAGMPRELARDLFSTKVWNKFVPVVLADDVESKDDKSKGRNGFWGHLHHSWAEYNKEQREAVAAFDRDLEKLVLQSTMTGADPMAYISGRLFRPGDDIEGFSVVQILDREVIVTRAGRKAVLAMK